MMRSWKLFSCVAILVYGVTSYAGSDSNFQEYFKNDGAFTNSSFSNIQVQIPRDSNGLTKLNLGDSENELFEISNLSGGTPRTFELGMRGAAMFGPGDPTNDMLGAGFFARIQMTPNWTVGIGFDRLNFDVETPIDAVGLRAPEEDADGTSDSFSGWFERSGKISDRWNWFMSAGASYASLSVGEVIGMTNEGEPYHLINDISSEFTLLGEIGVRIELFGNLRFESAARAQQHFGDWQFHELNSGREGTIDDYRTVGLWLGLSFKVR